MHTQALPYILLLAFFWGTNIVASRSGIGEFNPYFFTMLRLVVASATFIPILLIQQGKFPTDRDLWKKAVISGIFGVSVPMPLFILSLQYQSSGIASIYVSLFPVFVAIAAHYFLPDEKMTRIKAIGVVLALCGTLFLALRGESGLVGIGRASPLGFILIIIGLLSETGNTIYVRRHMQDTDTTQVTAIRLLTAACVLTLITLLFGDMSIAQVTGAGYFSLAYAALIGALAGQFMAFYIQRRFSATAFSLTSFLIPIFATGFGALLLGEIVTWSMGIGVLFIGSGLYLINYARK